MPQRETEKEKGLVEKADPDLPITDLLILVTSAGDILLHPILKWFFTI